MIGDPNRSQMIMVTKTKNPRPINSALPQGNGCGASTEGHNLNGPVSGRVEHSPVPPAQFENPDVIRFTPMSSTVGPVTSGGNI